jgi:hypothetical protein
MTVEELKIQLDQLRNEFDAFKLRATPVIDQHLPHSPAMAFTPIDMNVVFQAVQADLHKRTL